MLKTQLLSPVFVGRDPELHALVRLLEEAVEGRGGTALVAGDAGIGKSRLCRELKGEAAARGLRVIEGRCSPAESSVPYGPFMDALRFRIARGESEEAAQVLEPVLGRVAPLFSELAARADGGSTKPAGVHNPFEPIFGVLRRLTQLGPVLMIVEDIHWADPTSRDLIHYLARRLAGERVLLLVTFRTDELHPGHPVHRLAATLARERLAERVELEPLSRDGVASMLAAMLESEPREDFMEAVVGRSEGNPLFVEELVSGLAQTRPEKAPDFDKDDLEAAAPPATIHDVVLGRLEPLGGDALVALSVAAVIGRRFRFDVLCAALGWTEARLLDLLERLVAHRILIEEWAAGEESYAFRHSLTQEVLYGRTIGRRRRLWHRRVAAALESTESNERLPHTTLAHHYRLGGDPQASLRHAVEAGDEAARLCAWTDAESMYEEALTALEQGPANRTLEAELLEKMSQIAWWQNRASASEQYAEEALALHRECGDVARTAALLRRLGNLRAYQHADRPGGIEMLEEAQALMEGREPTPDEVLILNDLGRLHVLGGRYHAAEVVLLRALERGQELGDCAEEALTLVMLGRIAILRGQMPAGLARLELARALLAEGSMPVERTAEVYHAAIRALEAAREHERARGWVDDALAYAREHEVTADSAIFRAYGAAVARRAGRWGAALQTAREAADELRSTGRAELGEALRIVGDLYRVHGRLQPARAVYEEALSLGHDTAAVGLALVAGAEGRWEHAAPALEAALADHPEVERLFALRVLPLLVEARLRSGDTDAAERELGRLESLVAACDYPPGPAALAHASGRVLGARGRTDEAVTSLEEAQRRWTELALPYEAACARLDSAELRIDADPADQVGIARAREAAVAFTELGAALELERARRVLLRAGIRIPARENGSAPAVPAPLDQLTDREREVLAELTGGGTNKEIARALAIKPKTVGNHVSSILAKLGCATRTEAAGIALALRFDGGLKSPPTLGPSRAI